MSWKDRLRPASFKGEQFFVESNSRTLGRRVVQHEFPNRETPSTQDMGRISDNNDIEGYILGEDYDLARERLEKVFNSYGPGELIHPYYGSKIVQIGAVEFNESPRQGGALFFTAKFYEAGEEKFPRGVDDKSAILAEDADGALLAAKNEFDNNFSISGLPSFAVDSARALVASAQETFDSAAAPARAAAEAMAQLSYSTRNLVAETNRLLQSPSELSDRLLDSFNLLQSVFSTSDDETKALTYFYTFGAEQEDVEPITPVRERERKNQEVFKNFMIRVSLIKSCQTIQATEFLSFDDAETARDSLTDLIEEQIESSIESDVYQSLMDINASFINSVPDPDADLPRLKDYVSEKTDSALLISYDLFESLDSEDDIIRRNKIRHPGFIPENTNLEVIDVE